MIVPLIILGSDGHDHLAAHAPLAASNIFLYMATAFPVAKVGRP